jgi:RHS repeat-associated protein
VPTSGATIDLQGPTVSETIAPELDDPLVFIAASDPADGAVDVSVTPRLELRFSRRARTDTVSADTVVLASGAGPVSVQVVPAESGRLAFVTPTTPLEPETTYLLTVTGVRGAGSDAFPTLTRAFTTGAAAGPATEPDDDPVWDPLGEGRTREWNTNRPESPWQRLPRLLAPPGVTAVSGQVLRLNGSPLAGVTLRLEGRTVTTDGTGRFLLMHQGLATGWHEFWMDGRTANGRGATYGTFEVAVRVTAGGTTVLPYTSWMPRLDTAHAVRIASPTATETVVTTPLIPGLELRLAPGTVITDEDGRTVREVSITPIPIDRTPFPLPVGVDVPIYFTIQPGGAYVAVTGTNGRTRGARLIYPNYRGQPAGTRMEFWHYEPDEGREWYVYGNGAVSPDARQVVPDPGVGIYKFTGAMVASPGLAPTIWAALMRALGGDPVDLGSGLFILEDTDLYLADTLPLRLDRTYRPNDTRTRSFGIGATHAYDMFLVGATSPYTYIDLILPDGARVHYDRVSPGTGFADAVYEHTSSGTRFYKSRITWNAGLWWDLALKDGTRMEFFESFSVARPSQAAVKRIRDRYGNEIYLTRNADRDLTRVASPNGRWIDFTYDASHRVTQAKDSINRVVQYTYDAAGRLWKVTDVRGGVTEYTYDAAHRMLTIKDPRGIVYLTNEYNAAGRVTKQTQADASTFQFAYTLDAGGNVIQTDMTDPRGTVRRVTFGATRYPLTDTYALGQPEQQVTTWEWQSGTNFPTAQTDALGRRTAYTYDSLGNRTTVTRLAGTGNAVTETYTYEPTFSQVTSMTDPLGRTTMLTYDSLGKLTSAMAPLNRETTFTYTGVGQVASVTDPLGHQTTFGYDAGDLVSRTDPLGRTTTAFIDAAGRPVALTNPLGQTTRYEYNARDQITKVTDALGAQTTLTYEPNGRVQTLVDAKGGTTTYTYNNMDRVATRVDPLSRGSSYVYDANGNPLQQTDRKGQVTTYTYDRLNRLATVTYADTSGTTRTYDAGDRVTQVVDSVAGTMTRSYDGLDRLTSETTPEGGVTYTYNAVNRRASMTVAGQPAVAYTHDTADRVTAITQGSSVVSMAYDSADRRTTLTLPNGVVVTSGYDAANRLTGLTYSLGAATLGTLTYGYDLAGQRTVVGGTWARAGLPAALTGATYDAANQVTQWGGVNLTYDANSNLTNDGTRSYAWNARNELAGLTGGISASFQYDGLGRRRAKTVGGTSTGFLYDGLNPVQELTGGLPFANLLTGLDIDETLLRTTPAGVQHLLTDALGSTVAEVNSAGVVGTQYTYQPFGATTTTGPTSANTSQFTGRENDGTGLHYFRARYQHPTLQRFVSEDPLGFAGGINLHAYVGNAPTMYRDPLGLKPVGSGTGDGAGDGPDGPDGCGPVVGVSVGVGATGTGPFTPIPNVAAGASASVGVNTAGQFFVTGQVTGTAGVGGFWGWGGQAGRSFSGGPVSSGWSGGRYAEAMAGWGPGAASGAVSTGNGGADMTTGAGRLGQGFGVYAGVGGYGSGTLATPPIFCW